MSDLGLQYFVPVCLLECRIYLSIRTDMVKVLIIICIEGHAVDYLLWLIVLPSLNIVQSNFNGSNIFGTIENCSRHG